MERSIIRLKGVTGSGDFAHHMEGDKVIEFISPGRGVVLRELPWSKGSGATALLTTNKNQYCMRYDKEKDRYYGNLSGIFVHVYTKRTVATLYYWK